MHAALRGTAGGRRREAQGARSRQPRPPVPRERAPRSLRRCQIAARRRDPVGMEIEEVLLIRSVELRQTRNGSPFLRMTLGDRSSTLPAVLWDADERAVEIASPGE